MARLRHYCCPALIAVLALAGALPAAAEDAPQPPPEGLYDRPVLVLDPGMHTAMIGSADVDAVGRYAVTGSDDKTVRVWSVADGHLERTIRVPAGPGYLGKVYAVAISPDAKLIAAGGWTVSTGQSEQIYLFDRGSGRIVQRIGGLPDVVLHLIFSLDGRRLAATLLGANGVRVYGREEESWAEVARDTDYGDSSYGADFSTDGRLATTSLDGHVRLYDEALHLIAKVKVPGERQAVGLGFSPDGSKLAVGYENTTAVDLLDGHTLAKQAKLPAPDTAGVDSGNLHTVAWSADGETLFAGGSYSRGDGKLVVTWIAGGIGARREWPAGMDTISSLVPLSNGSLLVAAADPYLAVLDPLGREQWAHTAPNADFRGQDNMLAVSTDGQKIDFGYELWGKAPARLDVAKLALTSGLSDGGATATPDQDSLPIDGWENTSHPTLNGKPLRFARYEISRSLAIHPDGKRFVLGTEWSLRAYDAEGKQLWRDDVPGAVWAVNISGDGRLVVAAYGDGTIRWHRMDDGKELLAFFPVTYPPTPGRQTSDRSNWVAWTPDGFYDSTPGVYGVLRWHVNHGWDGPGEAIPVSDIPDLRRPDVLPLVLREMDIARVVGVSGLDQARTATQRRLNSAIKPGAQLHVLAIGISDYNEEHAKQLRLQFADRDASEVASALLNTQGSLYAKVNPQFLLDKEANRAGIFRALDTIEKTMQKDDVAVIDFSGHGALIGGKLYLLPYEVDTTDAVSIKASAIEVGELATELRALGDRGRVLVLLDACHSGETTMDGGAMTVDAGLLRAALATNNVTVLTSSSSNEVSREDPKWGHGAFTKAFLDALGSAADTDHNGVISMTELTSYLTAEVVRLTDGQQTPGVEMRSTRTIFAAGL